jgi:hypothetical protein
VDALDPQLIGDALTPGLLFAGLIAIIRVAINQADKRASVAEEREKVCTGTLAATTITTAALTEEIRKSGNENSQQLSDIRQRMDDGARRLASLESTMRVQNEVDRRAKDGS